VETARLAWVFVAIPLSCGGGSRARGPDAPTPVVATPTCMATPSASSTATVAAKPKVVEQEDPRPCEPQWPKGLGAVAVGWNSCPEDLSHWFVARGFPAVSKDGQRVALAYRQEFSAVSSTNLRVIIRGVDTDKIVETSSILEAFELGEPYTPATPEVKAKLSERLAKANEKVADYVPMEVDGGCASPLPWPSDSFGRFEGCTASSPPAQTIVCGTRKGASTHHVLTLTMKPPRLAAGLDAEKAPFLVRDISTWTQGWDSNFTPGGKGKIDRFIPPHLESAAVDFDRRVLAIEIDFCNTADSQPRFPSEWHLYRLPKLAATK
jgi:hypothetical protein